MGDLYIGMVHDSLVFHWYTLRASGSRGPSTIICVVTDDNNGDDGPSIGCS